MAYIVMACRVVAYYATGVLTSIIIMAFKSIYSTMALYLNDWENYRTRTEWYEPLKRAVTATTMTAMSNRSTLRRPFVIVDKRKRQSPDGSAAHPLALLDRLWEAR